MEAAKVHEELSSFLAKHSLADSVSNIDEIVLSYLLGIIELIGQGSVEDCFDLEDVTEMMNAYLPGFDQIEKSLVMEWMLSLAAQMVKSEDCEDEKCPQNNPLPETGAQEKQNGTNKEWEVAAHQPPDEIPNKKKGSKFPHYDFTVNNAVEGRVSVVPQDKDVIPDSSTDTKSCHDCLNGKDKAVNPSPSSSPILFISSNSLTEPSSSSHLTTSAGTVPWSSSSASSIKEKFRNSKRKGRQLSCSSQESQDDLSKIDGPLGVEDTRVLSLLEMFPAACSVEAIHCLQLSGGDMDRAAQLIMDRQETGQAISSQLKVSRTPHKAKKTSEYKLDDESIKSCVLKKYSFIDTEEDKKTHKPPPLKGEAKKLVRYRDGQVVSVKGERYSEVKKANTEDTYVNLKPARKYRFH